MAEKDDAFKLIRQRDAAIKRGEQAEAENARLTAQLADTEAQLTDARDALADAMRAQVQLADTEVQLTAVRGESERRFQWATGLAERLLRIAVTVLPYTKGQDRPFNHTCQDVLDIVEEAALHAAQGRPQPMFDFLAHLARQADFSRRTFGPGARTAGVVDHIRKELCEIEEKPHDLSEWIDVVILGLDGAWRAGHSPEQIVAALVAKQAKNKARNWPDWRTAAPNKAIEHVRDEPAQAQPPRTTTEGG